MPQERPPVATSPAKRAFDVTLASLGLLLLSPVILATALLVRWKLGAPVLFRQTRPGLNGEPFEILAHPV